MKKQIATTGELRDFLVTMMVGVKDGIVPIEKASSITKLAGQINESIYAEIKASRLKMDIGIEADKLGNMGIGFNNDINS
jgi:hypothetical protein